MTSITPLESNTSRDQTLAQTNAKRKEIAKNFLQHLDNDCDQFTFQTFDDVKNRKDSSLTRMLIGSLDEHFNTLLDLNERGAGVFVTVNQTDSLGRRLKNITRVRAVFQEADNPDVPLPELEPHIEVQSSPGKFHRYWFIAPETAPPIEEWRDVMRRMVADFGSDPNAQDPSRVLRLPGFYHQKNLGSRHRVKFTVKSEAAPYTWDEIIKAIPPLEKAQHKKTNAQSVSNNLDQPLKISGALNAINPDCDYDQWLKIGMALHHATEGNEEGFKLWDEWSTKGKSYYPGEAEQKWESFDNSTDNLVTIATLFHYAKEAGWRDELSKSKESTGRESNASELIGLVCNICEFWHDENKDAYATFTRGNHHEHWKLDSKGFKEWLFFKAYTELNITLRSESINTIANVLSGKAQFSGQEKKVFKRIGNDESGYWIDLCDSEWRAILITANGWKIVNNPPIIFCRTQSMRPLPIPQTGGNVDLLWQFTNIPEADRRLVLAWILECYRCDTPYPVLELIGEQGSAKSSTQRALIPITDRNSNNIVFSFGRGHHGTEGKWDGAT